MSYAELISNARDALKSVPSNYPIMKSWYGPAGYDWNGTRVTNSAGIGAYVQLDENLVYLKKRIIFNLQFIFDNLQENREPSWNESSQRYTSRGKDEIFYTLNGYANSAKTIEELDTSKSTEEEQAWIPHYDLYYCRSNLYDLISGANEGKYLVKVTNTLIYNLNKVCKRFQQEYESWVKTASKEVSWSTSETDEVTGTTTTDSGSYVIKWYRNGSFPNSTANFCMPAWKEIMATETTGSGDNEQTYTYGTGKYHWVADAPTGSTMAYVASGTTGSGGESGDSLGFPADEEFWTETKQREAYNAIVDSVLSAILEVANDFNIISTTIIDILELFEAYSGKMSMVNHFIMDEDKVYLEDTTRAVPVWKKVDKTGFSRYNYDVGDAYSYFITCCQEYDNRFSKKQVWERSNILSKLAQHYIMTDLNYWNKAWEWYDGIIKFREKRSI